MLELIVVLLQILLYGALVTIAYFLDASVKCFILLILFLAIGRTLLVQNV